MSYPCTRTTAAVHTSSTSHPARLQKPAPSTIINIMNSEPANQVQQAQEQEQQQKTSEPQPQNQEPQQKLKKLSPRTHIALTIVIAIIISGFLALLAFTLFKYLTDQNQNTSQNQNQNHNQTTQTNHIFTSETYPKWDGSTATQPLLLAFYQNFTGNTTAQLADFSLTKTHEAITKVINKDIDLAITTHPSEAEIAAATAAGIELQITPVANEGFVFFVSQDNPIENLSTLQIQDIYQGNITNWNRVGGNNLTITPYQRPENSGSQTGMKELVMKDKTLMAPKTEDITVDSMSQIVGLVSNYSNSPDAIGYSYHYYITTMYQDIDKNTADGIKLLSIDGIHPTATTITDKTYPFTTSYYIIARKNDTNESTQKLLDAMLSEEGQEITKKANYVPVQ